ncbi:MAG: GyrI-like domain-containing protein [Chloroflexi bacterium]|nr:GyrI-like domain-containing protein [Chloroflexota bacterium]MCI0644716.1 GyrI-like domain-containing protein [Chloroflexota bacterium]
MIDGKGDPNTSQEYVAALAALYAVAYTLKFMSKQELGRDYGVPPLEGLWWASDMSVFAPDQTDRDAWQWTMMIMTPEWIRLEQFAGAVEAARRKKSPPELDHVRLETFHEGLSVQILHVGPYSVEGPTIARLHGEYLPQHGLVENGKHHEVYLGDPRRTAPEKLKTVLRQPVRIAAKNVMG